MRVSSALLLLCASLSTAFPAADSNPQSIEARVTYRDNYVIFTGRSTNDQVSEIVYTVTGLSITDGQDPSTLNKAGDVHTSDSGAQVKQLAFKVGRSGSSKVAQWFKSNIGTNQNTFGQDPEELNFAFLGNLEVTYADSDRSRTYTFKDVALAQGHAGANNNWWFGCKTCTKVDGAIVRTTGRDKATGALVYFEFGRGFTYNDPNYVDVYRKLT